MSDKHFTIEIFCSYAQADELLSNKLEKHLSVLSREGFITIWSKRRIEAGTDWAKALDHHLNTASVILLLISADFVASDYCYGIEMRHAMARHQTGESCVIPILLRPVNWQEAPFAYLQMLPTEGRPITAWRNRDAAFADVVASIRQAMEDQSLLLVIRSLIEGFTPPSEGTSHAEESRSKLLKILSVLKEGYEREGHSRSGLELLATSASLLNLMANYLAECRQYAKAELFLERVLVIQEKEKGSEHPDTARSLSNLGLLYSHQGKYDQVEPLLQRALAIREQQLGSEHLETAISLDALGVLYEKLDQLDQAEPLLQRALTIRERQLGSEHPETSTSLNNLAVFYVKQEKYAQAESLCQRALAIREQQLGPNHLDTAASLNNLGAIYASQGKNVQAEPLLQRALAIREQQLGSEHPETVDSQEYLALLHENLAKTNSCEPLPLHFYMRVTPGN